MKTDVTLTAESGRIFLAGRLYDLRERIKQTTGGARWHAERKQWSIANSPRALRALLDSLGDEITPHMDETVSALAGAADSIDKAERIKICDLATLQQPVLDAQTTAWEHQIRAYNFIHSQPSALLYMKMGTGKTLVSVAAVTNSDDRLVLVLAPSHVVADDVWGKEFRKRSADPSRISVVSLAGKIDKRIEQMRYIVTMVAPKIPAMKYVIVTNHEALSSPKFREAVEMLYWDRIILDECHRFKSPGGVWSRCASRLTQRSKRRLGLTGTPMNDRLDIYSQARFLDPGLFGTRFAAFKERYALLDRFGRPTQWINSDEFERKISSISFYAGDDVVKLPATHDQEITFELSDDERKHYRSMRDFMLTKLRDEPFSVSNAIGKLLRLRQITGGFLQDGDTKQRIGTSKADTLRELLADLDPKERVVVFACFHADIDIIKERCADRPVYEMSGREKANLDEWRASDGGILVCQIDAASTGIDLTAAAYVVYYSTTFSLITYQQSRKRSHRPGQDRPVTYYHLIAAGTVDQKVYEALATKHDEESAFIRAITAAVFDESDDER